MAYDSQFWLALDKFKDWQIKNFPQMRNARPKSFEEDAQLKKQMLRGIETIMKDTTESLAQGISPVLRVPRKQIKEDGTVTMTEDILTMSKCHHMKKFVIILEVLSKAYALSTSSTTSTKRDLYYENVSLYGHQRHIDLAIEEAAMMLNVPRRILNINATGKGLISGMLSYRTQEGFYTNVMEFPQGLLVPNCVWGLLELSSEARFVLVVEKDATFQKLIDAKFLIQFQPCILVTGKGYPDLCTRELLYRLWTELHLPILALCDADPFGIHIASVYKFGSVARDDPDLKIDALGLVGILPSDLIGLQLPSKVLQKLTPGDIGKLASLSAQPELSQKSAWIDEGGTNMNESFLSLYRFVMSALHPEKRYIRNPSYYEHELGCNKLM